MMIFLVPSAMANAKDIFKQLTENSMMKISQKKVITYWMAQMLTVSIFPFSTIMSRIVIIKNMRITNEYMIPIS